VWCGDIKHEVLILAFKIDYQYLKKGFVACMGNLKDGGKKNYNLPEYLASKVMALI
jgi:hypothetical protein